MRPSRSLLLTLAVFSALVPTEARTAGIVITPTRVQLSSDQLASWIEIRNDDAIPHLFQVRTFGWGQQNAKDVLTPSNDLIVSPPIFSLDPGALQVIRIGPRAASNEPGERTYRLVIKELVSPLQTRRSVALVWAFSVPVFLGPRDQSPPSFAVSARLLSKNRLRVLVANTGNAHLQITHLRLFAGAPSGPVAYDGNVVTYILAGDARAVELRLSRPIAGSTVFAEAQTDSGTFHVPVVMLR